MTEAREPGAEHPLDGMPGKATVGQWAAENLPQDEFDKLADRLQQRDLARRLPNDVEGIGTRRRAPKTREP